MCDPATAGLIISAVAGGMSAKSNRDTLKRQDRQAARGIKNQAENQVEANRRVNEQIQDIAGSTGESEQAAVLGDFQSALRTGRADTDASQQDVVGASDRFAERVGSGREATKAQGSEQAERLSVIDGILRQRVGEGVDIGRTGSDINAIRGNVSAEDFLTQLRVAGERPNAGMDFAANLAGGIGAGMSQRAPSSSGGIPAGGIQPITVRPAVRTTGPFGG